MDNSLLSILLKLFENKDLLNLVTQFFSKQGMACNCNNKSEVKNEVNNANNMPLYPEPLYYPQNKDNSTTINNTPPSNEYVSSDKLNISSLLSSLSSLNISDLFNKISPILNIANSLKSKELNNPLLDKVSDCVLEEDLLIKL